MFAFSLPAKPHSECFDWDIKRAATQGETNTPHWVGRDIIALYDFKFGFIYFINALFYQNIQYNFQI